MKIPDLIFKTNPIINESNIQNYYGKQVEGIDLDETNQRFAISIVGKDGQPKYDPRYVRLLAQYHEKNADGSQEFIDLPLHDCTEEDFAEFHTLDADSAAYVKTFETELGIELKDTMKCLNADDYKGQMIKPNSIRKLSIMLMPCHKMPFGPYEVGPECIDDPEQQKAYIE